MPDNFSGVFSTGATGAIAPALLRKRLIAPAILHLPYSVQGTDSNTESFRSLKFDVTFSCDLLYPRIFRQKNLQAYVIMHQYYKTFLITTTAKHSVRLGPYFSLSHTFTASGMALVSKNPKKYFTNKSVEFLRYN